MSFQAFRLFDGDGNGLVTIEELRRIFDKVGGNMTKDKAQSIFAQVIVPGEYFHLFSNPD